MTRGVAVLRAPLALALLLVQTRLVRLTELIDLLVVDVLVVAGGATTVALGCSGTCDARISATGSGSGCRLGARLAVIVVITVLIDGGLILRTLGGASLIGVNLLPAVLVVGELGVTAVVLIVVRFGGLTIMGLADGARRGALASVASASGIQTVGLSEALIDLRAGGASLFGALGCGLLLLASLVAGAVGLQLCFASAQLLFLDLQSVAFSLLAQLGSTGPICFLLTFLLFLRGAGRGSDTDDDRDHNEHRNHDQDRDHPAGEVVHGRRSFPGARGRLPICATFREREDCTRSDVSGATSETFLHVVAAGVGSERSVGVGAPGVPGVVGPKPLRRMWRSVRMFSVRS